VHSTNKIEQGGVMQFVATGGNGDNALIKLARTTAAGGHHSTATALRRLAQAGYASMEQVDNTSDWILLSIPGMGIKRLGKVRQLSRSDWQPPSVQAIQAVSWFLSAAQFALRYWPMETLTSMIQNSAPAKAVGGSVDKQLAMDVFSEATQKARQYCDAEETIQALWRVSGSCADGSLPVPGPEPDSGIQPPAMTNDHVETSTPDLLVMPADEEDVAQDNGHFAFPCHKRLEIVRSFWIAYERGEIENKDAWARSQHQINGKTLLCYEREFQDQKQAILAEARGR